jgi:uncharacterized integral membrane protein
MKDIHRQSRPTKVKAAAVVVLVLLTTIVVFQNRATVDTQVIFGTLTMPLALLLALTYGVGLLTGGYLIGRWARRKQREA